MEFRGKKNQTLRNFQFNETISLWKKKLIVNVFYYTSVLIVANKSIKLVGTYYIPITACGELKWNCWTD